MCGTDGNGQWCNGLYSSQLDVVFNAVPLLAFILSVSCKGVQVCARDAVLLHAVGTALACSGCISVFICWGGASSRKDIK